MNYEKSEYQPMNNTDEISRRIFERVDQERSEFQKQPDGHWTFPSKKVFEALEANEDGDAVLFINLHRGRFCFDHSGRRWYEWTGHFWQEDLIDKATEALSAVIDVYVNEARRQQWERLKAEKSGKREQAEKHAKNEIALIKRIRTLRTKTRKENVLSLARTGAASLGITGDEWDRDPWLLGCLNGVVDLRTGELRPGRPEDFIKTVAGAEWRGLNEPASTWERFLTEIFCSDTELIAFIRRVCGYCITGQTTEHLLLILWGKGRNGKGTFLETLAVTLGGYAGQVEAELILKQKFLKSSGGPTSDIMALRGKRLVWASETDEGRKVNAGKIKWLTGGDTLTGREMYGRHQVSFRPSHKLFLLTNHKPHAAADDYALWQRIHLIPFTLSFVNDPQSADERRADPTLPEKLKAEASGISAWLVRGCLEWQGQGLNPPATVKAATAEYQEEEDLLRRFVDEKCQIGPKLEVQAGSFYKSFREWGDQIGLKPMSGVSFGNQMKKRFDHYKDRTGIHYLGVSLCEGCE